MKGLLSILVCTAALSAGSAGAAPGAAVLASSRNSKPGRAPRRSNELGRLCDHGPGSPSRASQASGCSRPRRASTCRRPTSAFWIGLGGFLEQLRSRSSRPARSRTARPAPPRTRPGTSFIRKAPVMLKMSVRPGDTFSATVSVAKKTVLIRIKNVTTNRLFTKKLHMARPDLGSAEWVAEAPSGCDSAGNCTTSPLTNFGTVAFAQHSERQGPQGSYHRPGLVGDGDRAPRRPSEQRFSGRRERDSRSRWP